MDAVAVRLARGRPAIDLALGEIFLRMAEGGHIEELCFAKRTDLPPRSTRSSKTGHPCARKIHATLRSRTSEYSAAIRSMLLKPCSRSVCSDARRSSIGRRRAGPSRRGASSR